MSLETQDRDARRSRRDPAQARSGDPPAPWQAARLPHLRRAFRSHHDYDPLLARGAASVNVLPVVLLGHAVDERLVRVGIDALDGASDLQVAIGVVLVDDRDGDARIALKVADLLPCGRLAEPDVAILVVEP